MKIVINNQEDGFHIGQLANTPYNPSYDICLATHDTVTDKFLGGVILTNFTGASAFLHEGSVTEKWLCRDFIWMVFHYPFVQLGCRSLIGMTPSDNTNALAFALKFGFEIETRIKDCLPGGADLIVTRMWREKCRWLNLRPRSWMDRQEVQKKPLPAMGNWLLGSGDV